VAQTPVAKTHYDYSRTISWVIFLGIVVGGGISLPQWLPIVKAWVTPQQTEEGHGQGTAAEPDSHAGHEDHAEHATVRNFIEISDSARKNIHLETGVLKLSAYERVITVPGMIAERRGRSKIEITAPLTGVVTKVYPIEGEAMYPGQPLFEMRVTHEELVQLQSDLLKTTEELLVMRREVERLEKVAKDGGIASKTLLEHKYELQKHEAQLESQKQALLLHGLAAADIETIISTRKLQGTYTVSVPTNKEMDMAVRQVHAIHVEHGQHVETGASLAVLTDHSELIIDGNAFERDATFIAQAMEAKKNISLVVDGQSNSQLVEGLRIQYLSSKVEEESRSLHFYVALPNQLRSDTGKESVHRFIDWLYKPGQRVQLRVPVETWQQKIVVPIDAIAQDGVETYVFRANGSGFDRQPVHVEYKDSLYVVIAHDGQVFPGETISFSGAQQLQLALKNQLGGGIDPHAGHSH
jgi:membrane fusion protein, heavy metal efflux system